jgi:mannitol-specific phosphotransferase system IIBC component
MKTTIVTAIILAAATTSASAYTCKNTIETINGEIVYTASQCGNQAPASAGMLELMTFIANNPPKDNVEEVVEVTAPVVVAPVVEPTKLEKLNTRLDNLKDRKSNLQDKIKAATGKKKKALKNKRKKLNKQINKVNNRINKVNGNSSSNTGNVVKTAS